MTAPIPLLPLMTGVVARRVPENALLVTALVLAAVGCFWLTTIGPGSSVGALAGPLVTFGVGIGMSTGLVDGMALASVHPDRAGVASGMFGTSRLALETVSIGVVGSILAAGTGGTLAGAGYTGALRASLWLLGGLLVLAVAVFLVLSARSRRDQARFVGDDHELGAVAGG